MKREILPAIRVRDVTRVLANFHLCEPPRLTGRRGVRESDQSGVPARTDATRSSRIALLAGLSLPRWESAVLRLVRARAPPRWWSDDTPVTISIRGAPRSRLRSAASSSANHPECGTTMPGHCSLTATCPINHPVYTARIQRRSAIIDRPCGVKTSRRKRARNARQRGRFIYLEHKIYISNMYKLCSLLYFMWSCNHLMISQCQYSCLWFVYRFKREVKFTLCNQGQSDCRWYWNYKTIFGQYVQN